MQLDAEGEVYRCQEQELESSCQEPVNSCHLVQNHAVAYRPAGCYYKAEDSGSPAAAQHASVHHLIEQNHDAYLADLDNSGVAGDYPHFLDSDNNWWLEGGCYLSWHNLHNSGGFFHLAHENAAVEWVLASRYRCCCYSVPIFQQDCLKSDHEDRETADSVAVVLDWYPEP